MFQPPLPQLPPEDAVLTDGVLRSSRFGDIYFSTDGGLAETRHVFINGTGLNNRLANNDRLVIAETGFGTGLNFLAVCAEVLRTNSKSKIDYVSVEGCPPSKQLVAQALSSFSELADLRGELLRQWPRRWLGVHHLSFLNGQIDLHLHYGQAEQVLPTLDFGADIWFMDGFSPAKNPDLWSAQICQQIARLSAHEASLATFTVAAAVRSALTDAGFTIKKTPGFGRKRDMLTASYNKGFARMKPVSAHSVLVIGGGIAGCAVAGSLQTLGCDVTILDAADQPGAGASGNPAGIVVPFLTVGDMLSSRLSISCLADTRKFLDANQLILSDGVVSLDHDDRKTSRQKKLAAQGFPSDLATYKEADELSALTGLPLSRSGLFFEAGAVIRPQSYAHYLAASVPRFDGAKVNGVSGSAGDWLVDCTDGRQFTADHLVFCSGADLPFLLQLVDQDLGTFQVTSGQLSKLPSTTSLAASQVALNYSGYLTPVIEGCQYLGAGFDPAGDTAVTMAGHLHNLDLMPAELQELAGDISAWGGRTSRRLAYPDRLPLAGQLIPGVSVVSALGARGLTLANLIGKSVARQITGHVPLLPYQILAGLNPQRFFEKTLS